MDILRRYEGITFHSSSDWSRARSFAKVTDKTSVRSSFVTLLLTNNTVRRLPCPFDGDCSAGRPYRCAWRARSRRPYTRATCERRIDAKASSDEAVVDAEVDRCIDENSGSWAYFITFGTFEVPPKFFEPAKVPSVASIFCSIDEGVR